MGEKREGRGGENACDGKISVPRMRGEGERDVRARERARENSVGERRERGVRGGKFYLTDERRRRGGIMRRKNF